MRGGVGADVVGFSIVVPGDDWLVSLRLRKRERLEVCGEERPTLDEVELVAHGQDLVPSGFPEQFRVEYPVLGVGYLLAKVGADCLVSLLPYWSKYVGNNSLHQGETGAM